MIGIMSLEYYLAASANHNRGALALVASGAVTGVSIYGEGC